MKAISVPLYGIQFMYIKNLTTIKQCIKHIKHKRVKFSTLLKCEPAKI